jgi:YjbE family integral membrane protein
MGLDAVWHSLSMTLQVSFIDLLLSGDNAIVIALACRSLPAAQMRQAILIGTAAGIGLRVLFTGMVTLLLNLPGLKLLGMAALIVIAIKLVVDESSGPSNNTDADSGEAQADVSLWPTVSVIVTADLVMSLDNVVALAAVTQNSLFFLLLGLALSVPLLMYGSLFVTGLLQRYPLLIPAGGALLGWVSGDIGSSDPLIADWVTTQAPALTLAMPLACAIFVLLESRIIQKNLELLPALAPRIAAPAKNLSRMVPTQSSAAVAPQTVIAAATPATDQAAPTGPHDGPPKHIFSGPFLPYLLIAIVATAVLSVIGSIVYKGFANDGLMPKPSSLIRYECPGSAGSYSFYFRHGLERVQIRSSAGMLQGNLHDGKIDWVNYAGGTGVLGFSPPTEITYDDAKSIRVNGGSSLQVDCAITEQPAARR